MKIKINLLILFSLFLTSCTTSFINSGTLPGTGTELTIFEEFQPKGMEKFSYELKDWYKIPKIERGVFENRLETTLTEKNIFGADSNLVLEITFEEYFIRDASSRFMGGVMAGVDNITTSVIIKNKENGQVLGRFNAISKNATAWGSKNSLIEQHADKIASFLQ
tara:strand:+ start:258 stop:749 length:492 start_codon:yes stop_codon:yes gene_type:complete